RFRRSTDDGPCDVRGRILRLSPRRFNVASRAKRAPRTEALRSFPGVVGSRRWTGGGLCGGAGWRAVHELLASGTRLLLDGRPSYLYGGSAPTTSSRRSATARRGLVRGLARRVRRRRLSRKLH